MKVFANFGFDKMSINLCIIRVLNEYRLNEIFRIILFCFKKILINECLPVFISLINYKYLNIIL